MSAKDCGHHGHGCRRHMLYRRIFALILAIIIVALFVFLVIWLVLRPTKPRFYLQDASVSQFNITEPNYLSSIIQVTISSRNPNDRIGIYYDKLDVYASYKEQQITIATAIPRGYQGHNDVNVWSPYLYGTSIPVSPYLAMAIQQNENAGVLLLYVKIEGQLRWKVGSWISGRYHINANCPAFFTVDNGKGNGDWPSIRFQQISSCSVDV